ncbi:unnamed protein product, partial [Amoebophrya sp. A25]|eukprot:GSA25T00006753001.1
MPSKKAARKQAAALTDHTKPKAVVKSRDKGKKEAGNLAKMGGSHDSPSSPSQAKTLSALQEQQLLMSENMALRIVYSAKRLRRFLQQSEILTCRGCSKRLRCPMFKKPAPPEPTTATCADVVKILFGLAQYCRGYLRLLANCSAG